MNNMKNIQLDMIKLQGNIAKIGFYPLFLKINRDYYNELLEKGYIKTIQHKITTANKEDIIKENNKGELCDDTVAYSLLKCINTELVIDDDIKEGFKIVWG